MNHQDLAGLLPISLLPQNVSGTNLRAASRRGMFFLPSDPTDRDDGFVAESRWRKRQADEIGWRNAGIAVCALTFGLCAIANTSSVAQPDCASLPLGVERTNCFILRGRLEKQRSQLQADKALLDINEERRKRSSGPTFKQRRPPSKPSETKLR
ncbi:MAG: hypothetical protein ACR2PG_06860 [Hyphomicrobiaceae bacterium]